MLIGSSAGVAEMGEIHDTMELFGGFGHAVGASGERVGGVDLYQEMADIFQYVSECRELQTRIQVGEQGSVSADEVAELCGQGRESLERL